MRCCVTSGAAQGHGTSEGSSCRAAVSKGAFQAPSVGAASIPRQQLLAFARLSALAPGEVRDVSLAVPRDALALVDEAGVLRVQAGTWRLWLGGGPPDAAAFGGGSCPGRPSGACRYRIQV